MVIERYISNLLESNMYLIYENGHVFIIDPFVTDIDLKGITIDFIALTHEHYDHISGVKYWKEKYNVAVIASMECKKGCLSPKKNMSSFFDLFCELQNWVECKKAMRVEEYICDVDETFEGEYHLNWEGHDIFFEECPGHSKGSCMISIDDKILFSGDSVFKDYQTECRFPNGSKRKWENESKKKVMDKNINMEVYPGHFEPFILGDSILTHFR